MGNDISNNEMFVTSSAILDAINIYFDSSMTIIYYRKKVENGKIWQIIAKIDFLRIFPPKKKFWENRTSGFHGNTFARVTSKSTNLAIITLAFHENLVT